MSKIEGGTRKTQKDRAKKETREVEQSEKGVVFKTSEQVGWFSFAKRSTGLEMVIAVLSWYYYCCACMRVAAPRQITRDIFYGQPRTLRDAGCISARYL